MNNNLVINKLSDLPALPNVIYELTQIINDPMSSVSEVEKIMINDQTLSAKVLKLANSSYYSVSGGVGSLSRAISFLGFNTINELVMSSSILKMFKVNSTEFNLQNFWLYSLGVAYSSASIGDYLELDNSSDLFTAGLLHDIGKLALIHINPNDFIKIYNRSREMNSCFSEEESKDGYNTALIGFEIAKRWKFPLLIQKCIFYSGNDLKKAKTDYLLTPEILKSIDVINLAKILTINKNFGDGCNFSKNINKDDFVNRLKLSNQDVVKINELTEKSFSKAAQYLSILK